MERVIGTILPSGAAARPATKPGVAFKQALARAMEGWGPDAPAAALRGRPGATQAAAAGAATAAQGTAPAPAPVQRAALAGGPPPVQLAALTAMPAGRQAMASATAAEWPASFRHLIARLESGAPTRPDGGYGARNPASGALGRYQMLPVALRDIGWQDAAGQWTPLAASHGVRSEADFLASPAAQEAAMSAFLRRTEALLERNGSFALTGTSLAGLDGAAVPVTDAGLVAAAHRSGAQSVARYLAHRSSGADTPLSAADRATFAAVERRLRQFADMPYQVAATRRGGARSV